MNKSKREGGRTSLGQETDYCFVARKTRPSSPMTLPLHFLDSPIFSTPSNRASEPSPLAWKRRDSDTTGRPAPVPRVAIAKSWFSTFAFLPRRFQNLQNTVEDVFVRRRETGFSIKNKKTISIEFRHFQNVYSSTIKRGFLFIYKHLCLMSVL